jgi:hydrogenase nickel incorporation protein HypA/HybF
MHELSIARGIVRVVEAHARGRRVTSVTVQVGALRQVVLSALSFAFELVAQGTAAEGAELELEHVPAGIRCRSCGRESELDEFPFACRACGGVDVEVVRGEELLVWRLELLDEGVLAGTCKEAAAGIPSLSYLTIEQM